MNQPEQQQEVPGMAAGSSIIASSSVNSDMPSPSLAPVL